MLLWLVIIKALLFWCLHFSNAFQYMWDENVSHSTDK